jgi:hypothetical protein
MYAIVRMNSFDPSKLAGAAPRVDEFQRLHASQRGYAGSILVDLGEGQRLSINLWDSEDDANGALSTLEAEIGRVLVPLMAAPSRVLGAGPVVSSDVARA